jgi:K+-sensing histidine kinase KdpD
MSSKPSATGAAPLEAQSAEQPRGRLKVFIGMAAGVGKTFRMLLEGQAELRS